MRSFVTLSSYAILDPKRKHPKAKEKFGYRVHFKKLSGEGPDEGWLSCYIRGYEVAKCRDPIDWIQRKVVLPSSISFNMSSPSKVAKLDQDSMWDALVKFDRSNYLMAASIHSGKSGEHRREDGLVEGHAYSIIHAVERRGLKLVCCRTRCRRAVLFCGAVQFGSVALRLVQFPAKYFCLNYFCLSDQLVFECAGGDACCAALHFGAWIRKLWVQCLVLKKLPFLKFDTRAQGQARVIIPRACSNLVGPQWS